MIGTDGMIRVSYRIDLGDFQRETNNKWTSGPQDVLKPLTNIRPSELIKHRQNRIKPIRLSFIRQTDIYANFNCHKKSNAINGTFISQN